jgi:hypothetical protein
MIKDDLARIYAKQARWSEAELMRLQLAEAAKETLGSEHGITLQTMDQLVRVYGYQHRFKDRNTMAARLIEALEQVSNDETAYASVSLGRPGHLCSAIGRWKDAGDVHLKSLGAVQNHARSVQPANTGTIRKHF